MPDQPRSFCNEMTGSLNEERAILSLNFTLSKAFDAVSHINLAAKLGYRADVGENLTVLSGSKGRSQEFKY